MKKLVLLLAGVIISYCLQAQTSYHWIGGTSSDWGTSSNWSPSGVPSTGDSVYVTGGPFTYDPVLDQDRTINTIQILDTNTVDLGGYELTVNGDEQIIGRYEFHLFDGKLAGYINNGKIVFNNSTNLLLSGIIINATTEFNTEGIYFSGCTFYHTANLAATGSDHYINFERTIFNDSLLILAQDTAYVESYSCTFNGPVVIDSIINTTVSILNGTGGGGIHGLGIYTNNQFNDDVIIKNCVDAFISVGGDFNNGILVNNIDTSYVSFSGVLVDGKTVTIGEDGFNRGNLRFVRFTQIGTTPQSLSLSGNSNLFLGNEYTMHGGLFSNYSLWNAELDFTAANIYVENSTFNNDIVLTKTGANYNNAASSYSYSFFNGNVTLNIDSTGNWEWNRKSFNKDLYINQNSSGVYKCIDLDTIRGSIYIVSDNANDIYLSGAAQYVGDSTQLLTKIGDSKIFFGDLKLDKSSGDLIINSPINIEARLLLNNGRVISTHSTDTVNVYHYFTYHWSSPAYTYGEAGASVNSYIDAPLTYRDIYVNNWPLGSDSIYFPLGHNGLYKPLIFVPTTSINNSICVLSASYIDTAQTLGTTTDTTLSNLSNCEYWSFAKLSTDTIAGFLRLGWDSSSCNNASPYNMRITQWDSTLWKNVGGNNYTGDYTAGTTRSDTLKEFGYFTLANTPCTSSAEINVSGPTSFCQGTAIYLISPGIYHLWNTEETTEHIYPDTSGTYSLTFRDIEGCIGTDSIDITVWPIPVVDVGPDLTIYLGDTIQLNADISVNVTPVSVYWDTGYYLNDYFITNPLASPVTTTEYQISVFNDHYCYNRDTLIVKVCPNDIIVDVGNDTLLVLGDSLQLNAAVINATDSLIYSWQPTTGLSDSTIFNPIANPTVNTTYVLTVSTMAGCTYTDSMSIFVCPTQLINLGPDILLTYMQEFQLNTDTVAGIAPFIYAWDPYHPISQYDIPNPTITAMYTDIYILMVTDSMGCTDTDTVKVKVCNGDYIELNIGSDLVINIGDSIQLNPTYYSPNQLEFTWYPSTGFSDNTVVNPFINPTATTTYILKVETENGCTKSDTITVYVCPHQLVNAGADTVASVYNAFEFNATVTGGIPPYTYAWDYNHSLSQYDILNPTTWPGLSSDYILTVTDSLGCIDSDTINVKVCGYGIVAAGTDATIAIGDSLQLSGSIGSWFAPLTQFYWSPTATLSDTSIYDPFASPLLNTDYILTAIDDSGCVYRDTVKIMLECTVIAFAGTDTVIIAGDTIQLNANASGGISPYGYNWSPSAGLSDTTIVNPLATPDSLIDYVFTVTDANGCIAHDTVRVIPVVRLVCGEYHNNRAQELDSLEVERPVKILDRFGNEYLPEDIAIPVILSDYGTCDAGMFKLYYEDMLANGGSGNGQGFDAPGALGAARRDAVCQVYKDLDHLLFDVNQSNAGRVKILVRSNAIVPMPPNVGGWSQPFYVVPNGLNNAFLESEITKTIKTGEDSYDGIPPNLLDPQSQGMYHGIIAINFPQQNIWHLDYSQNNTNPSKNDLYTVVLHEAGHSIGFFTRLTVSGTSVLQSTCPNCYGLFDRFLKYNGTDLITPNTAPPTQLTYTGPGALNISCATGIVEFTGPLVGTEDVHNSTVWNQGTNLSHYGCHANANSIFDPNYYGQPNSDYVMNPGALVNQPGVKRFYNIAEYKTFCQLGFQFKDYSGQSEFGTLTSDLYTLNPALTWTPHTTYDPCNSCQTAGIPDFYTTPYNTAIDITLTDIIGNDVNNTMTGDVYLISTNAGTLTNITGGYTFTPDANYAGLAILGYYPKCSDGTYGGLTLIYIDIAVPLLAECEDPNPCNILCYGDFELPHPFFNSFRFNSFLNSGWPNNTPDLHYYQSPDMYGMNTFVPPTPVLLNTRPLSCIVQNQYPSFNSWLPHWPTPQAASGTYDGGNQYMGIAYEGITMPLQDNHPMVIGCTYELKLIAYNQRNVPTEPHYQDCLPELTIYGSYEDPCPFGSTPAMVIPGLSACGANPFTVELGRIQIPPDVVWNEYVLPINPSLITNFPALGVKNIYIVQREVNPPTSNPHSYAYLLFDNVEIRKLCADNINITATPDQFNIFNCQNTFDLTYEVCLEGTGFNLNDVDLQLDLPSGAGFTISGGDFSPTGEYTIPSNTISETNCLTLTAEITIPNPTTLGSYVFSLGGNVSEEYCFSDIADATVNILSNPLTLTKSASTNPVIAGQPFTYYIEVCNPTNQTFADVTIDDFVPSNLTIDNVGDFTDLGGNHLQLTADIPPSSPLCTVFSFTAIADVADLGCCAINTINNCAQLHTEDSECKLSSCYEVSVQTNSGLALLQNVTATQVYTDWATNGSSSIYNSIIDPTSDANNLILTTGYNEPTSTPDPSEPAFTICGTFTIDMPQVTFLNANVKMGTNAKITFATSNASTNRLLKIEDSWLHSCGDYLWDGIYAVSSNPSGFNRTINSDDSRIEDAKYAIVSDKCSDINIHTTVFNKSFEHIVIKNCLNIVHPGEVYENEFKCTQALLPASPVLPGSPILTKRAIEITNLLTITIGNFGTGANTFTQSDVGIYSSVSSLVVKNCQFTNFIGTAHNTNPVTLLDQLGVSATVQKGTAVLAFGASNRTTGISVLGTPLSTPDNIFTECTRGVFVGGSMHVNISDNVFNDGYNSIYIWSCRNNNVTIARNNLNYNYDPSFGAARYGIILQDIGAGSNNIVRQNSIVFTNNISLLGKAMYHGTGIIVRNPTQIAPTGANQNHVTVSGNNITDCHIGVMFANVRSQLSNTVRNTQILANRIDVLEYPSKNAMRFGIYNLRSSNTHIYRNRVSSSSAETDRIDVEGIRNESSIGAQVYCNLINNDAFVTNNSFNGIGRAITFNNISTGSLFYDNIMQNARVGVRTFLAANTADQVNNINTPSIDVNDNQWLTDVVNFPNGRVQSAQTNNSLRTIFIRGNTTPVEFDLDNTTNTEAGGVRFNIVHSDAFFEFDCNELEWAKPGARWAGIRNEAKRIINDSITYPVFSTATRYQEKSAIYSMIKDHPDSMLVDAVIDSFYNANKTANIGLLWQADSLMGSYMINMASLPTDSIFLPADSAEYFTPVYEIDLDPVQDAEDILSGINPQNYVELATKTMSTITVNAMQRAWGITSSYAPGTFYGHKYTTAEWDSIQNYAYLCAFEYGAPVYAARNILAGVNDSLNEFWTAYVNPCETGDTSWARSIHHVNDETLSRIKVYPNPTTGILTVEATEGLENSVVDVYNNIGEIIYRTNLKGLITNITLPDLPNGVYWLRFTNSKAIIKTEKVVIMHE